MGRHQQRRSTGTPLRKITSATGAASATNVMQDTLEDGATTSAALNHGTAMIAEGQFDAISSVPLPPTTATSCPRSPLPHQLREHNEAMESLPISTPDVDASITMDRLQFTPRPRRQKGGNNTPSTRNITPKKKCKPAVLAALGQQSKPERKEVTASSKPALDSLCAVSTTAAAGAAAAAMMMAARAAEPSSTGKRRRNSSAKKLGAEKGEPAITAAAISSETAIVSSVAEEDSKFENATTIQPSPKKRARQNRKATVTRGSTVTTTAPTVALDDGCGVVMGGE